MSIASERAGDSGPEINVGITEREVSIVAGALAGWMALRDPLSFRGIVMGGLAFGLIKRGLSGHCALYESLGLDSRKALDQSTAEPEEYSQKAIHVEESITINKSADDLYAFWRNLENLPKFMEHVKEVRTIDDKHSHWKTRGPMSFNVDWDAEIINDEPGNLIAWQSVGEAEVDNAGSVRFVPVDGGGTEIKVTLDYIPPAGLIGHYVAKLLGEDPSTQCRNDLQRLKHLIEASPIGASNVTAEGMGS